MYQTLKKVAMLTYQMRKLKSNKKNKGKTLPIH